MTKTTKTAKDIPIKDYNEIVGMSTEEILSRFGAIPLDEFIDNLIEGIRNYKK